MKYFPPMVKHVDWGRTALFVDRKELSFDFYKFRTKAASNLTYCSLNRILFR